MAISKKAFLPTWRTTATMVAFFSGTALMAAEKAAETAAAAPSGPAAGHESVLDLIIMGGYVMIPLGLCSLLALTFFLERIIALKKNNIVPETFMPKIKPLITSNPPDLDKAFEYCVENKSPLAAAIKVGVEKWKKGRSKDDVEKNLADAAGREVSQMTRSLRIFRIVAAISPLLGLLGTVYGLIHSFQTVAADQKAIGKAALLAKGIYEAMVTTAAGLTIAIPTLVVYYFFLRKVDILADDMEAACNEFMDDYQEAVK